VINARFLGVRDTVALVGGPVSLIPHVFRRLVMAGQIGIGLIRTPTLRAT
jgi:hypothetical protein